MKATVKVLALLLVAVMMIGIFAGCQKTPATTTEGKQPEGTTAAGTPEGTTAAKELEPKTLKLMARATCMGSDYDLTRWEETNVYRRFKELCDAYKLTIEVQFIEEDQYKTVVQTTLAGGTESMPDVLYTGSGVNGTVIDAANAGLFAAIQDILEYSDGTASGVYAELPLYFKKNNLADGKTYWVGEYQEVWYQGKKVDLGYGAPTGMNFRDDWAAVLGMETPNTVAEMEAFIQACQDNDMNKNGIKDEGFYCYLTSFESALSKFYGLPAAQFGVNLANKKVETPWEHENVKDYLKKLIEWLDKGYIPGDCVGATSLSKYRKANAVALYGGYFCDNWSLVGCEVPEGAAPANLCGIIPDTTVHPDAYMGHDAAPQIDVRTLAFNANVDKEAAARFLDIVTSDAYMELIIYGTEGETFDYDSNGKPVWKDEFAGNNYNAESEFKLGRTIMSNGICPELHKNFHAEEDEMLCDTDLELATYKEAFWIPVKYSNQPAAYLAVPTPEETEALTLIETEYTTLAEEIFVAILLKEIDIDTEWDSKVIEPLKAAGMDEIKEIYQGRLDRMLG